MNGLHISLLLLFLLLHLKSDCQDLFNPQRGYNLNLIPAVQAIEIKKAHSILFHRIDIVKDQLFANEADYLIEEFDRIRLSDISRGQDLQLDASIIKKDRFGVYLRQDLTLESGYYTIDINANEIMLRASTTTDMFYASVTLIQLLALNKTNSSFLLPPLRIKDYAHFKWRGLLLDCCRHFFSVETIKKHIKAMAFYKMNTLHWHLTEDQGWRIEIDSFPLLTEIGAWRIEKNGEKYGGYYTKEDIKEIISFAKKHHIRVIPEIEMPGHSLAALASYPHLGCRDDSFKVGNKWGVFKDVYCAGNDQTFTFLEQVLDEVIDLFPEKYIHIGGDECPKSNWEKCSKCQARKEKEGLQTDDELQSYFIQRMATFLQQKGKQIIGWDEILEGGLAKGAIVQSWRGLEGAKEAMKEKHEVICSPTSHCYLDYSLKAIDLKKIYSFDPIPENTPDSLHYLIKGAEGNMWTEWVTNDSILDDRIYPRIIGLAEVLWRYNPSRSYKNFTTRLQSHYALLDVYGIQYGAEGLPMEIKAKSGKNALDIKVIKAKKDLDISYQFTKSKIKESTYYQEPFTIKNDQTIQFQAFRKGQPYGAVITKAYSVHKGIDRDITLNYAYSPFYPASGKKALIDGCLGSIDYRDGNWQGVKGDHIEAVVDLGENRSITSIKTHFLHKQDSWIFIPQKVIFSVSNDGITYKILDSLQSDLSIQTDKTLIEPFVLKSLNETARYVKLQAINQEKCPIWHDAAGSKTWLFIDEFVIN